MRFCLHSIAASVLLASPVLAGGLAQDGKSSASHAKVVPVLKADPRSGQVVKTIIVAPKPLDRVLVPTAVRTPSAEMKGLVESAAKSYDVPLALVDSVIQVESNYDASAVSPKGAQGLMQLMPATAKRFGVKDSFDPKQNIEGGVRYLKFLQETFKDDRLAIAAYNAGEGAVQRFGDVPPYPETLDYVAKVGKRIGQAKKQPSKKAAEVENVVKEPEFRHLAEFVSADGKLYLTTQ